MAFAHHVVGLESSRSVFESSRVRGLATKCFSNKCKTEARFPFTASEILTLEDIVIGNSGRSIVDRHVAGCFLYMIFARARFSDMMNVSKLSFEFAVVDNETVGYIESEVARSKTSFSVDRKVRLLPMTAAVRGLSPDPTPWGMAWKDVIEKAGITVSVGKPLLPGRTRDGWHTLPLTAEAGGAWLRTLLQSSEHFDVDRLHRVGTYSCKSTCLSWLSKYGADADTRRLMGYHVADKMSTMLIYGKDNTSAGLRLLDEIIMKIRLEEFLPDAPRAGMFPKTPSTQQVDVPAVADMPPVESSSEDSADESEPDHEAHERAQEHVLGRFDSGINVAALLTDSVYFRHTMSRMIHVMEDESGERFGCGRRIEKGYTKLASRPVTLLPICKQCFHKYRKG